MNIKNKKSRKSFYQILAVNYIIFTCLVLIAFFLIYQAYGLLVRKIAPIPDAVGFVENVEKKGEKALEGADVFRYLGEDSLAELVDEEGKVAVWQGTGARKAAYEEDALYCIQEYFSDAGFVAAELPKGSRGGSYLITRVEYGENGETSITGYRLLDDEGNALSGTLFARKDSFSQEELLYLKGFDEEGRRIYKYSFLDEQGAKWRLVMHFTEPTDGQLQTAYESWNYIWCFFIPIYLCIAGLCIYFLNRKTKNLLMPLNQAIVRLKEGKSGQLEDYQGPEEFMEIAENFDRMEKGLKRNNEERRRLLADISHDLKTPATVIRGYGTALRDGIVPEEEKDAYLDTIVKKADRIGELLSAFYEYSKLDHPDMKPQLKKEDLCEICREYFADKYQELEIGGFGLEAEIPEKPLFCEIDKKLFYRALDNLVQNCLAYAGKEATIIFRIVQENGQAIISFGDNGKGIPADMAERIFRPFVTGDSSRSKSGGSGLGLSIVKQIVALHGGTIRLEVPPEAGYSTEFIIKLPLLENP